MPHAPRGENAPGFVDRGYILWQEFQSNEAAQTRVFRLINDAHSAATKLLKNSIVSDGLADHGLIRLSY